ncbi:MAG: hypothetical protein Q9P90_12525 [candidate division KSB1 bacterium]|nr:hypothetical protein [candidate division KSB1 bacterium]
MRATGCATLFCDKTNGYRIAVACDDGAELRYWLLQNGAIGQFENPVHSVQRFLLADKQDLQDWVKMEIETMHSGNHIGLSFGVCGINNFGNKAITENKPTEEEKSLFLWEIFNNFNFTDRTPLFVPGRNVGSTGKMER